MQKYIIIAATQVRRNLFVGTLDELNAIANAGNSAVFEVTAEAAAKPWDEDDAKSGPAYPEGAGWYYQRNSSDEDHKAESQLDAICAVLGDDTHFFRFFTEDEARKILAVGGIKGHFGIEATNLLRSHFERQ